MTFAEFEGSLRAERPPEGLSAPLRALWHDAREAWDAAHACVQGEEGADAAWVHAYLHRKEGDHGNAAYWYRRAGRELARGPLDEEWRRIAGEFAEGG